MTVILTPIQSQSTEQKPDRWARLELSDAWKKFTGRDEPKPNIDQSPNRGCGWMK